MMGRQLQTGVIAGHALDNVTVALKTARIPWVPDTVVRGLTIISGHVAPDRIGLRHCCTAEPASHAGSLGPMAYSVGDLLQDGYVPLRPATHWPELHRPLPQVGLIRVLPDIHEDRGCVIPACTATWHYLTSPGRYGSGVRTGTTTRSCARGSALNR